MSYLTWNVDPEIFRIGSFGPRYYGLLFAAGFLVGYQIMQSVFRRENRKEEDLSSLLFHLMIGTIVGARLGHCLFYEPSYYLSNPIEMLYIWKGGLASHGGTIGVLLSIWLYTNNHKDQSLLWLTSRLTVPCAFASFCIRLGNFFNSEIIGKPSNLPWAIVFQRVDNIPRHPAMLYEALLYLLVFA
ncbi:MAG: prolipoprotein diacylglyceryl transferase, partial [Oligoflexales bacterium]|nr:prolipoprotein diacylglyceryl transferase [Oligoflexales bacterium]